jgi:hypothetical protein
MRIQIVLNKYHLWVFSVRSTVGNGSYIFMYIRLNSNVIFNASDGCFSLVTRVPMALCGIFITCSINRVVRFLMLK